MSSERRSTVTSHVYMKHVTRLVDGNRESERVKTCTHRSVFIPGLRRFDAIVDDLQVVVAVSRVC